jgi:hypothetical protein
MKSKWFIVWAMAVCLILSACSGQSMSSSDSNSSSHEDIGASESVVEPSEETDSKEDDLTGASLDSAKNVPGYAQKDLGEFSIWLPENAIVEIYDTESGLIIADLTSVDTITDTESPFAAYDRKYSDAKMISEYRQFGAYTGKCYWMQDQIPNGTAYFNRDIYCIKAENKMIVLTMYPVFGPTGAAEQKEKFEKILGSIEVEPESEDDVTEASSESAKNAPGYVKKDLGEFSIWLPENSVIKIYYEADPESTSLIESMASNGNMTLLGNMTPAYLVADLTSVDAITDTESPFAAYDRKYSDAKTISEYRQFGAYTGKWYWMQELRDEVYTNRISYCIKAEDKMIVITLQLYSELGDFSDQMEGFEKVLRSIEV